MCNFLHAVITLLPKLRKHVPGGPAEPHPERRLAPHAVHDSTATERGQRAAETGRILETESVQVRVLFRYTACTSKTTFISRGIRFPAILPSFLKLQRL